MTGMHALWLPIVLSSVFVFIVSSVIHMASPWHKGDYPKLANQEAIMDALRPFALPPDDYLLPRPSSRKDMMSPAFTELSNKGPRVLMTIMEPGPINMAKPLGGWFVYLLVVNAFGAFVAGRALPLGADVMRVYQFVGITTFLGYSLALWQASIWWQKSLSITIKSTIDGLIYAAIAAGTFGWLWPH